MRKSLFLLMTTIVLFPSLASAQTPQAPKPGDYEIVIIDVGQNVPTPSLTTGSGQIHVTPLDLPPLCVVQALNYCVSASGGISGTRSDFAAGQWTLFPDGKYLVEMEYGGAIRDPLTNKLTGVATFISPVKAFITYPHAGITVSGTNLWVVMWAEGTTGSANVFTLSADGNQIGGGIGSSSNGPVTIFWNMTGVAKGAHTLRADVLDAAGNTGSTTLSFILQ